MPKLYPPKEAKFSMTGSTLLPDTTIEQIAMCGERIDTGHAFQNACHLNAALLSQVMLFKMAAI
jgi:hypothetical protein